jgi:hypothetical protein
MIRIFLISIMSSVFLTGLVGIAPINLSQNTFAIKTGSCPHMAALWHATYGAGLLVHGQTSRLKELSPACVVFDGRVSGTPTIDKDSHGDSDGDLHILLTPDAKDDSDLMNSANGNRMTVEVICWGRPSPSYTNEWGPFCNNVDPHGHIPDLRDGDHVRITGKWVQDIGYPKPTHAQWNEIHPVESIEKIS